MSDIIERLHVVRNHLRTGRFGQREVWEEWLTEAAEEVVQLQAAGQSFQTEAGRQCVLRKDAEADNERLRTQCGGNCRYWEGRWRDEKAEIERLRAALQGALSMVDSFASGAGFSTSGRTEYESYRAALEPKP